MSSPSSYVCWLKAIKMPAKSTNTGPESGHQEVLEFLKNLDHPLKREIEAVRSIILDSGNGLTEHIKWKAPSFCFAGDDRITFNLHGKDFFSLVFHRGAKAKPPKVQGRLFEDTTGLLEWAADDRAIAIFADMKDVEEKREALKATIRKWLKMTTDQGS